MEQGYVEMPEVWKKINELPDEPNRKLCTRHGRTNYWWYPAYLMSVPSTLNTAVLPLFLMWRGFNNSSPNRNYLNKVKLWIQQVLRCPVTELKPPLWLVTDASGGTIVPHVQVLATSKLLKGGKFLPFLERHFHVVRIDGALVVVPKMYRDVVLNFQRVNYMQSSWTPPDVLYALMVGNKLPRLDVSKYPIVRSGHFTSYATPGHRTAKFPMLGCIVYVDDLINRIIGIDYAKGAEHGTHI